LDECLTQFASVRHLADRPGHVALALWFHDAIYDVKAKSNEEQSADWALTSFSAAGANLDDQKLVVQLILATKHDISPRQGDEQLLVDIDLSILGATPERFAEYDRQVRAEYSWVPDFIYNMKRRSVLRSFVARPYIFSTNYFRDRYEEQARINLSTVT
jgi:predicted metal-dependent HD superfamily phosphohydrolase